MCVWFNPYNRESREKNAMVMYTNCLDPDPSLKIRIHWIRIRIKIRWIHITDWHRVKCKLKYGTYPLDCFIRASILSCRETSMCDSSREKKTLIKSLVVVCLIFWDFHLVYKIKICLIFLEINNKHVFFLLVQDLQGQVHTFWFKLRGITY